MRAPGGRCGASRRALPWARAAAGFTLIEVVVALAIVAIGMAAVLSTLSASADTAYYLRDKTFAEWIALNRIAQVRLSGQLPGTGRSDGELDYAGRHWRWQQDVSDLGFPGIYRIDVEVQQADTPKGKDAPFIATAIGVVGDAVAPPKSSSDYIEFTPEPAGGPGAGAGAGTGVQAPGATILPNGQVAPPAPSPGNLGGPT